MFFFFFQSHARFLTFERKTRYTINQFVIQANHKFSTDYQTLLIALNLARLIRTILVS